MSGQGAGDFLGAHRRFKHRSCGLSAAAFRLQSQHLKRAASAQPLLGCYKPHPPALKQVLFRGYVHHRMAQLWKNHAQLYVFLPAAFVSNSSPDSFLNFPFETNAILVLSARC